MADTLTQLLTTRKRVLLVGPPGIAKTGRIHATAEKCGYRVEVWRMVEKERIDFGGAFVPDVERRVTVQCPLEALHALQTTTDPVVLFLDDIGQAPEPEQAACMRLFDKGALGPNVVIWGATNRATDRAGARSPIEPLRSRFSATFALPTPDAPTESASGATLLHDWSTEVELWCAWAVEHAIAPEIVAWHRATNGRTLYTWRPNSDPAVRMADYRTWEDSSDMWRDGLRSLHLQSATLGKPVASEFTAFAAMASQLATPDQVRLDPESAPVPTESSPLYLVASMLGAAAAPHDVESFMRYCYRMPRIYGALLATDMYYNRKLAARMASSPTFVRFFNENPELFTR